MIKANRNITGTIFNIQKFSIHDGPGIRTVVFFKGCPLHCQWCSNPESQLMKRQILWNSKNCVHCRSCQSTCPHNAISLNLSQIQIDNTLCQGCIQCVQTCPNKALSYEGEQKTVQEVLDIVLQDQAFYEESDGGITLSGGEFLLQPNFAKNLLISAKEEGLHTCCETTGFANSKIFLDCIEHLDMLLFDVKHWDEKKHIQATGVSNKPILENLKIAIQHNKNVLVRIPVIPGFNNSLTDAAMFCELFHQMGINTCQLLPFHQFGESKYPLLNKNYIYSNQPSLHQEDLKDYVRIFHEHQIDAFF